MFDAYYNNYDVSIACIDGVNWKSFDAIKLSAQWDQSLKTHLPVLTLQQQQQQQLVAAATDTEKTSNKQ